MSDSFAKKENRGLPDWRVDDGPGRNQAPPPTAQEPKALELSGYPRLPKRPGHRRTDHFTEVKWEPVIIRVETRIIAD